jgi:hypothetical protein
VKDYPVSVTTTIPAKILDWLNDKADVLGISRALLIRELIVKGCHSVDSSLPESMTNVINVVADIRSTPNKKGAKK